MTKDEALKMAIEALEDASCMVYSEFSIQNEYEYEINACKKALAQSAKEPQYLYVGTNDEDEWDFSLSKYLIKSSPNHKYIGKIKLEVDDD